MEEVALTHDDYRALPGVNFSTLKHVADSPAHYAAALREPPQDRDVFRVGRLFHTLTMEPHLFERDYVVFNGRRAGKDWESFAAANTDRTIVKPDEVTACQSMATAVRASPLVDPYWRDARHELTVQWVDHATGIGCKARLDWLSPAGLVDLKSARTTEARAFGRAAAGYHYPAQLAFYRRAARELGHEGPACLVAVEKSSPWDVAVFRLDEAALEWGDFLIDEWLATLARCRASGDYPGRYTAPVPLLLPHYAGVDANDLPEDYLP